MMRRVVPLLVAVLLGAAPSLSAASAVDPAVESLSAQVDLERKSRAEDLVDLGRLTDVVARLSAEVSDRRARLLDALKAASPRPEALDDAQEALDEAEARLRAADERRRTLASRVVEKSRRVSLLLDEIMRRRGRGRLYPDPVTGRWEWTINPGPRKGTMTLRLDGTLVAGEYVLDGGFRGSLRGTYVGEKLSLQRIDSDRGFDANFWGQMSLSPRRLMGTWEATAIAPTTGPVAGTWGATVLPEKDDGAEEK